MPDPEMSKIKIGTTLRNLKDAAARAAIAIINGLLETITTKLNGIEAGAQVNVIETVKVDGSALPVSSKAVNIPEATQSADGAMSSTDKTKLDGVASGAQANVIETVKVAGLALSVNNKAVDVPAATQSDPGVMSASDKTKLDGVASGAQENVIESVKVAGTALSVSNKAVDVPIATQSDPGVMSAADKTKLDGIASGATAVTVDSSMSDSSENPVQNKVIKGALDGKSDTGHTHDDRYYTEAETDSLLSGKVAKVGDTMTGPLDRTFENIDLSDATADKSYSQFRGFDKNGDILSGIMGVQTSSNYAGIRIGARRMVNDSEVANNLNLYVGPTGTRTVAVSEKDPWKEALDIDDLETAMGGVKFIKATANSNGGKVTYTFTNYCSFVILCSGANANVRAQIHGNVTTGGTVSVSQYNFGSSPSVTTTTSSNKLVLTNSNTGGNSYTCMIVFYGTAPTAATS